MVAGPASVCYGMRKANFKERQWRARRSQVPVIKGPLAFEKSVISEKASFNFSNDKYVTINMLIVYPCQSR